VNCVAIATTLALGGGISFYYFQQYQGEQRLSGISAGLRRFEQVLAFHGASKDAEVTERGWPLTVDATWFSGDTPQNLLLTPDRPWLEVATPEQATMMDPPLRIALSSSVASFWYNPYLGVIRARVPIAISDAKALTLYNRINGTSLDNIYSADAAPDPTPKAVDTGTPAEASEPSLSPEAPAPARNQASAGETPHTPPQ
jgi:hypothetical protein